MLRNPNPSIIAVALLAVVLAVFAGTGYAAPGGNGKGQGSGGQSTTPSTSTTTTGTTTSTTTITTATTNSGSSTNGKGRGQADPSCAASPNPAVAGQSFMLSAIGLPTTGALWLIVQPPSGTSSVSEIWANADGSWSGTEFVNQSGTWTYTFSGVMSNNKYGGVASCSEQVTNLGAV